MASAGHVLLAVHVAVDLAFEKLDGGVSVGISPNREPLAGEGPVQGVVFAFALAREILFVRTRDAMKMLTTRSASLKGSNWKRSFVFMFEMCS